MAITITPGSATISTTEYFLASNSTSATYQTATCFVQATISFHAMVAGDQYVVRGYRYVNSTRREMFPPITLSGVQASALQVSLGAVGGTTASWEFSVQRTAGSDRAVTWDLVTTA